MEGRVTPWYSWEEWKFVKRLLYSFADANAQQRGIDMVALWKSNVRPGALPVSVELTSSLIAVYLENNKPANQLNLEVCKLASAMALVRFVNGITDQLQTGEYAQSVQVIADKLNIPDWLVDLRHESTHAIIPGIDVLKSGIFFSLSWLEKNYWIETESKLCEHEMKVVTDAEECLLQFRETVNDILTLNDTNENGKEFKHKLHFQEELCKSISHKFTKMCNQSHVNIIVTLLLKENTFLYDGLFIKDYLSAKPIHESIVLDSSQIEKILYLGKLWNILLEPLHTKFKDFINRFVRKLFSIFSSLGNSSEKRFSVLMCLLILSQLNIENKDCFVNFLLENPSNFSFQILDTILAESNYSNDFKDLWYAFRNVFRKTICFVDSSKSLDDFEKALARNVDPCDVDMLMRLKREECKNLKALPKEHRKRKWKLLSHQDMFNLPPIGHCVEIEEHYLDATESASLSGIECKTLNVLPESKNKNYDMINYRGSNEPLDDTKAEEYWLEGTTQSKVIDFEVSGDNSENLVQVDKKDINIKSSDIMLF